MVSSYALIKWNMAEDKWAVHKTENGFTNIVAYYSDYNKASLHIEQLNEEMRSKNLGYRASKSIYGINTKA